jgi:hypothetical protein
MGGREVEVLVRSIKGRERGIRLGVVQEREEAILTSCFRGRERWQRVVSSLFNCFEL